MDQQQLKDFMSFNKDGELKIPMAVFEIDERYIISVFQGSLSDFDILIKYKQKINNNWSRIRTPKHIHWAVDILIKLHEDEIKTQAFLDFLLQTWEETLPIRNREQQEHILDIDILLQDDQNIIEQYETLSNKGEYSIKFLILLAKLLMIQEKTNMENAFMFKNLLKSLREKGDIFSAVSTASHNGR